MEDENGIDADYEQCLSDKTPSPTELTDEDIWVTAGIFDYYEEVLAEETENPDAELNADEFYQQKWIKFEKYTELKQELAEAYRKSDMWQTGVEDLTKALAESIPKAKVQTIVTDIEQGWGTITESILYRLKELLSGEAGK